MSSNSKTKSGKERQSAYRARLRAGGKTAREIWIVEKDYQRGRKSKRGLDQPPRGVDLRSWIIGWLDGHEL